MGEKTTIMKHFKQPPRFIIFLKEKWEPISEYLERKFAQLLIDWDEFANPRFDGKIIIDVPINNLFTTILRRQRMLYRLVIFQGIIVIILMIVVIRS